jgi:hypothetical protein
MKLINSIILVLFLSFVISAQETAPEQIKTEDELLKERVANLAALTSELMSDVDSLRKLVTSLKNEVERSKWNMLKEGMTKEEIINILGPYTRLEDASFGYKKLIFGEGYSGYVLFDKEMKSVEWSPPLNLRMKLNQ